MVEIYDENCTGSKGGTDETEKDWSYARHSRKVQPKKRPKYAGRKKKRFCELSRKTIQNPTTELQKFATSMNLSHMVVGSIFSKQGLPVCKENDATDRLRDPKATSEWTKGALLAKLVSRDSWEKVKTALQRKVVYNNGVCEPERPLSAHMSLVNKSIVFCLALRPEVQNVPM